MFKTIDLKTAPELRQLVQAADPTYKKHKVMLRITPRVTLSGTYWDGGTRSTYTAVNLSTKTASGAPQYDPPQFGGPRSTPEVELPQGACIVETGIFCGKTATATIYLNPADATPFLPA
jgi:hypothetical protein